MYLSGFIFLTSPMVPVITPIAHYKGAEGQGNATLAPRIRLNATLQVQSEIGSVKDRYKRRE